MHDLISIDTSQYLLELDRIARLEDIQTLREQIAKLKSDFTTKSLKKKILDKSVANGHTTLSRSFLLGELRQIEETRTIERARYYVRRLKKALSDIKTGAINDINLNRWKECDEIITDSLWILDKRDASGGHSAWYWGNFIPQIPRQLMLRYTKKGDWVLDPFAGSGTTLLECHRLERNCLGVELQPSIARKTRPLLKRLSGESSATVALEIGDSAKVDFASLLKRHGASSAQLAILHPPYHDIISFSKKQSDLSNASSPEEFARKFGGVVDNVNRVLDDGRYLAVVIGDKYEKGEWIPLGFLLMNEVLKRPYKLKSIVVKNFDRTLAKRNQKELWRYRALAGGFYVFKHEYILIFQKKR